MKRSIISWLFLSFLTILTSCGGASDEATSSLAAGPEGDAGFIHYFHANTQLVQPGQPVTLSWNLPLSSEVELVGISAANLPSQGTYLVNPNSTTSYTIRGKSLSGRIISRSLLVEVSAQPVTSSIEYFWASHLALNEGEASTLNWKINNCSRAYLDAIGDSAQSRVLPCSGSFELRPNFTTQFIVRAFDSMNRSVGSSALVIQVNPLPRVSPLIEAFWTNYLNLDAGSPANIYWNVRNASQVYLSTSPNQAMPFSGSITVRPLQTTSYILTALSAQGEVVSSQFTITVNARAPEFRQFQAEQPSLQLGQQTTLRWDIAFCAKVELIGDFRTPVACSGSLAIAPNQTTTYNLVATGFNGEVSNQIISVNVVQPQLTPTIEYFYADDALIDQGQSTTLRWKAQNCARVVINGNSLGCQASLAVTPNTAVVYQITAYSADGQKQASNVLQVNVRLPPPPTIEYFYASRTTIKWEEKSSLYWKVNNALKVELIGDSTQTVASTSALELQLVRTVNFVLRVYGFNGQVVEAPLTVTVIPPTEADLLEKLLKELQNGS